MKALRGRALLFGNRGAQDVLHIPCAAQQRSGSAGARFVSSRRAEQERRQAGAAHPAAAPRAASSGRSRSPRGGAAGRARCAGPCRSRRRTRARRGRSSWGTPRTRTCPWRACGSARATCRCRRTCRTASRPCPGTRGTAARPGRLARLRPIRTGWVQGAARALGRRQGLERRGARVLAGPVPAAAAAASPGAASAARLAAPSSTARRRPARGAGGAMEGAAGCADAAWCTWWWSPAGSPALINACQAGGGSLVNMGTLAHRKRCMPAPEAAWPVAAPAHSARSALATRGTHPMRISLGACGCDSRARRRSSRLSRPAAL